jgi:hypothetical protein
MEPQEIIDRLMTALRPHWPTLKVVVGTTISYVAIYLAYRGYTRKSGLRLRGSYGTTSTVQCEDDFVSHLTLENLKDRAVTIFAIYLRVGHNVYVVVEDFGTEPLILGAYQTYQKEYDPIEFYTFNMRRLKVGELLKDRKVKKCLMLSTSDGRYKVRKQLRVWNPVFSFFQNHLTIVVQPVRTEFKGKGYGSNVAFLVELELPRQQEQVIAIYRDDYKYKRFKDLGLTRESLKSKEALQELLDRAQNEGKLVAKSIVVHDVEKSRAQRFDTYNKETLVLPRIGAFRYYVLARLATKFSNWAMNRQNRQRAKQTKIAQREEQKGNRETKD